MSIKITADNDRAPQLFLRTHRPGAPEMRPMGGCSNWRKIGSPGIMNPIWRGADDPFSSVDHHAAEANRRSVDHFAGEYPRSRRHLSSASETRWLEADWATQGHPSNLPRNPRTSFHR